jgi:hypothetical protein
MLPQSAKRPILKYFGKSDEARTAVSKTKQPAVEIKGLAKRDDIAGYTNKRMKRLVHDSKLTTIDIKRFAKQGIDLRKVEGLIRHGVSKGNLQDLAKADANFALAYRLSDRGFSGDQLVYIVKHGSDANPKITLKQAERLKDLGFKPDDIVSISKNANSKYPVHVRGTKMPRSGVTTEQLITLRKQEIPVDHIKYYVEKGYSLKMVSYLSKQGRSPQEVRKIFDAAEEIQFVAFLYGKCRDTSASNKAADRTVIIGEYSIKLPQHCTI